MSRKQKGGIPLWPIVLAVPIAGIVIYLAVRSASAKKEYALIVTHSGSGTIDLSDGTHKYDEPTQVVINASPESGYQANWNINGIDVEQAVNQYSIYVTGVFSVAVSFVPIGGGPTQPTGIRAVGSIATLQNFRFWYGNPFASIDIAQCDENWNDGRCTARAMTFKVHDAAGMGVPNIDVQIYPEINPDATLYKTYCLFNGTAYSPSYPLILKTDADGLVKFDVFNMYGADNVNEDKGGIELSRGTNLWAHWLSAILMGYKMPVYHGLAAGLGAWWDGTGGGGTIIINRLIRAEILNTDKYTLESITYSYGVKWKT